MKRLAVLVALGAFALPSQISFAQPIGGIPGKLMENGSFHPFMMHKLTTETAGVGYSGKLKSGITISLATALTAGTTIQCSLNATVFGEDISTGNLLDDISELDTVTATVSGSKATCVPTIPYLWTLYGTNDQVTIGYTITALDSNGVGRTSSSQIAVIGVPGNGQTTTFSVKTTI